jgi:hypothetical protein
MPFRQGTAVALGLVTWIFLAALARPAEACTCVPSDLPRVYHWTYTTDVVRGVVRAAVRIGTETRYTVRVIRTYKGCAKPGRELQVWTADSSATCGIALAVGRSYLLTAHREGDRITANLCGYNRPFARLSADDLQFLSSRYNCCGDRCRCVKRRPVQCFVQPCEVRRCAEPGATCVDNYCGGCGAEWFTSENVPVCRPCAGDEDCPWGQGCIGGACLTQ